jgi:N-acetylglucosaminyl-diphospho-decaprenol L-rhamnosyltransferase
MTESPTLSIIIINWRSCEFLRKCLQSIRSTSSNLKIETIVIDNASYDGSREMVQNEFPGVLFVQSELNLGFAKANNLAYTKSTGRYLLFLNPDTEILDDALGRLVAGLESNSKAGIVGPKLLNTDMTVQTSCIQAYPTLLNQLLDAEYLRRKFPRSSLWGMNPLYSHASLPAAVDVVSGACLMIRRDVFEQVGRFSTNYFMYSEDVDLCYKTKLSGRRVMYIGDAAVVHHGGQSSVKKPESNFATVMIRESLYSFLRLRRGNVYAGLYRGTMAVAAIFRLGTLVAIYGLTLGRFHGELLSNALRKWNCVLRWAVGLEKWAKQSA